jgi:hypothetical protein
LIVRELRPHRVHQRGVEPPSVEVERLPVGEAPAPAGEGLACGRLRHVTIWREEVVPVLRPLSEHHACLADPGEPRAFDTTEPEEVAAEHEGAIEPFVEIGQPEPRVGRHDRVHVGDRRRLRDGPEADAVVPRRHDHHAAVGQELGPNSEHARGAGGLGHAPRGGSEQRTRMAQPLNRDRVGRRRAHAHQEQTVVQRNDRCREAEVPLNGERRRRAGRVAHDPGCRGQQDERVTVGRNRERFGEAGVVGPRETPSALTTATELGAQRGSDASRASVARLFHGALTSTQRVSATVLELEAKVTVVTAAVHVLDRRGAHVGGRTGISAVSASVDIGVGRSASEPEHGAGNAHGEIEASGPLAGQVAWQSHRGALLGQPHPTRSSPGVQSRAARASASRFRDNTR